MIPNQNPTNKKHNNDNYLWRRILRSKRLDWVGILIFNIYSLVLRFSSHLWILHCIPKYSLINKEIKWPWLTRFFCFNDAHVLTWSFQKMVNKNLSVAYSLSNASSSLLWPLCPQTHESLLLLTYFQYLFYTRAHNTYSFVYNLFRNLLFHCNLCSSRVKPNHLCKPTTSV